MDNKIKTKMVVFVFKKAYEILRLFRMKYLCLCVVMEDLNIEREFIIGKNEVFAAECGVIEIN